MGHNETVSRINQKRENKNKIDTQLPFHSSSTYRATFHIPTGLGGSFRDRRRRMVIRGLRGQLDRNRLAEALQERPRVRGHHRNNDAILNPHFINVRPTLTTTTTKRKASEGGGTGGGDAPRLAKYPSRSPCSALRDPTRSPPSK